MYTFTNSMICPPFFVNLNVHDIHRAPLLLVTPSFHLKNMAAKSAAGSTSGGFCSPEFFRDHVSSDPWAAAVLNVTPENINLYAQGRFDLIEKDLAVLTSGSWVLVKFLFVIIIIMISSLACAMVHWIDLELFALTMWQR